MKRGISVGCDSLVQIFLVAVIEVIVVVIVAVLFGAFARLDRLLLAQALRPEAHLVIIS